MSDRVRALRCGAGQRPVDRPWTLRVLASGIRTAGADGVAGAAGAVRVECRDGPAAGPESRGCGRRPSTRNGPAAGGPATRRSGGPAVRRPGGPRGGPGVSPRRLGEYGWTGVAAPPMDAGAGSAGRRYGGGGAADGASSSFTCAAFTALSVFCRAAWRRTRSLRGVRGVVDWCRGAGGPAVAGRPMIRLVRGAMPETAGRTSASPGGRRRRTTSDGLEPLRTTEQMVAPARHGGARPPHQEEL